MGRQATVIVAAFVVPWTAARAQDQPTPVPLTADLRITKNARIDPGAYMIPDRDDDGAVVITGDGITVDFAGSTLSGANEETAPDAYVGRGVVIRGKNITLKNAKVRGFKIGIYAENAPGLTLTNCDVSRNYRQRLKSGITHEHLDDWLYGHENDRNEWLRYGAGIYVLNSPNAKIANCRARNGQNGICLVRSDHAYIVDNDMSFMSGWGLAMWRSSHCDVFNNRFDWCIRGYSHGHYARGQDSAGILVYEQCSDNVFAFNSATHGGDGFFLYAGNETLRETGNGGCNNNLVYQNDFSHAAANGIEATFSKRNRFIDNTLDECTHGVWGGYSHETLVFRNTIRFSENGVSIEHGWNNAVIGNVIEDATIGIHLWFDADPELLASAYCKANHHCPSDSNAVLANRIRRTDTGIRLRKDTNSRLGQNGFHRVDKSIDVDDGVAGLQFELPIEEERTRAGRATAPDRLVQRFYPYPVITPEQRKRLEDKRGRQDAFLPSSAMRGREYIFIDEWGPYDFSDIRVFPDRVAGGARAQVQLLGPRSATFTTSKVEGDVTVAPREGALPRRVTIAAEKDGVHPFTAMFKADQATLKVTGTLVRTPWRVAFYRWTPEQDPRKAKDHLKAIVKQDPFYSDVFPAIDFAWRYGGPADDGPTDRFATVATTKLNLPAGRWRLRTVSDDGVRVRLDDKPVIENWTQHGPTEDSATVSFEEAGEHTIRIEHFEIEGYAQLQFFLEPAS